MEAPSGSDDAATSGSHPVVLFDGVCGFCCASIRFVIARDPDGYFRFAPLQSETAQRLIQASGFRDPLPDSLVLVEDGHVYLRSAAALRIARRLRFPWWLAYGFVVVPRVVRDWVYDAIARRRYRWFGKRDVCMVPTAEMRARFLP